MIYHLHFDREAAVIAHICERHRELGAQLACIDVDAEGNCPHVQTRPCTCSFERPCAACLDESMRERAN